MIGFLFRRPRAIARVAAVLYLLESAASLAGQMIIPGRLVVAGDAATTASNILANESTFRVAIALALLAVASHVVTGILFYYLLKPVGRTVALLSVLLLVTASGIQASAALMQSGALVALKGTRSLSAFSVEQLQGLSLMLLNWNGQTYNFYLVFFGFWCIAIGYLIYTSTFLPRLLGSAMVLAGLSYSVFLYPPLASYLSPYNLALAAGELGLVIWLLYRGVDAQRWSASAVAAGARP